MCGPSMAAIVASRPSANGSQKPVSSSQAAAVEHDVRSKAKTVQQMVSELDEKKVSL